MSQQATLFPLDIQPRIPADVCANRHKGSAESIIANPSVENKRRSHERILELLAAHDLTSKEIAGALGTDLHKISGRLAELKQMNRVMKTDERRDGAAVLTRV